MNETGASFDRGADFVLWINGRDNSRIVVDAYYDSYYFLYGEQYGMIPEVSANAVEKQRQFLTGCCSAPATK